MKGIKYFPDQRLAFQHALGFIEKLPPDTRWSFYISEEPNDATLNIWVHLGEINDYRAMLGLASYTYKEGRYVTYDVGPLDVSIIELDPEEEIDRDREY